MIANRPFLPYVIVALLALAGVARAQGPGTVGDPASALEQAREAQAAYERGMSARRTDPAASVAAFRESARLWESVRAEGAENGPLEFNLGNAYLESGDVGRAIASYLRAERFMPGDADLAQNLAHARSTVSSSFGRSGGTILVDSVTRWWHLVPRGSRVALGWACWVAFWIAVAAWLAKPAGALGRLPWRSATAAFAAGWVVFGGSVVADELLQAWRPRAVLVEPGVTLRKGNGDGYAEAFVETLGAGVECTVLEERPGWLRVELPDGRSGWLRDSQVDGATQGPRSPSTPRGPAS